MNKPMGGYEYNLRSLSDNRIAPILPDSWAPTIPARPPVAKSPPVRLPPPPRDVLAQCPKCKTVETLQVVGDVMTRSRRFSQRGADIYHDCGSEMPCRLHRVSSGTIGEKP